MWVLCTPPYDQKRSFSLRRADFWSPNLSREVRWKPSIQELSFFDQNGERFVFLVCAQTWFPVYISTPEAEGHTTLGPKESLGGSRGNVDAHEALSHETH